MTLDQALQTLVPELGTALLVHGSGYLSRRSHFTAGYPRSLYLGGAMGLASAIGVGIARQRPELRVVVLDGQEVPLPGSLEVTGGAKFPPNLIHLVVEQGAAPAAPLPTLSRTAYAWAERVSTPEELRAAWKRVANLPASSLLLIRVEPDPPGPGPAQLPFSPEQIRERFRRVLRGEEPQDEPPPPPPQPEAVPAVAAAVPEPASPPVPAAVPLSAVPLPAAPAGPIRSLVLLCPEPVVTSESVRRAADAMDLSPREPEVQAAYRELREGLVEVAGGGADTAAVLFPGGATALEAVIASVVPEGRRLLIVENGSQAVLARRMAEVHGVAHMALPLDWSQPVDPNDVDIVFRNNSTFSHLLVVRHERSNGLMNPVEALGRLCREHRRGLIVDASLSLGSEPTELKGHGIEYLVGTSGLSLQGLPGISFVLAGRPSLESLADRPPRSLALGLHEQWREQEAGAVEFLPPASLCLALRQALRELAGEGITSRNYRYRESARIFREGVTALQLTVLLRPDRRCPALTGVRLPSGVPYERLHAAMKQRGFLIAPAPGALEGQAFLVCHAGDRTPDQSHPVVQALAESLREIRVSRGPAAQEPETALAGV